MSVKTALKGFFVNRLAATSGIAVVSVAIFFVASSFVKHPDRDLLAKQVNLMIRQIGHQLLLQAGDSTSRVLPVSEVREGTFQLRFQNKLSFNNDSLVALSRNFLPKKHFPSGYTLTVHESQKADIVYGFQVNNGSPDIVACRGRHQPFDRYRIEISFPDLNKFKTTAWQDGSAIAFPSNESYPSLNLVVSGMLVLLGVTLLIGWFGKSSKPMPVLGKFRFDVKNRRLLFGDDIISLTDKECRILELLHKNFGELISREALMQEVWIKEGVITGRSLDMFVSKLRKKLINDPALRITNIHGKGYKLEIS